MDQRGEALLEMAESLGFIVLNDGKVPIFPFGNSMNHQETCTWEVLEDESMSDHQYVFFNIRATERITITGKRFW